MLPTFKRQCDLPSASSPFSVPKTSHTVALWGFDLPVYSPITTPNVPMSPVSHPSSLNLNMNFFLSLMLSRTLLTAANTV